MAETKNAKQIRLALESMGHTNVKVWWEPWGPAVEMCGPSGGYFYCSDQYQGNPPTERGQQGYGEPIGLTFAEAMQDMWMNEKYVKGA